MLRAGGRRGGEVVPESELPRQIVSRANAARASAVVDTQKAAIERAREIDPNAAIHVERVRDIGPGRDKWRKV
jgi:Uncharacterized protein conserved in bacteria (DUF2188)